MTRINQQSDLTATYQGADAAYRSNIYLGLFNDNETLASLQDGRIDANVFSDEARTFTQRVANNTGSPLSANALVGRSGYDGGLDAPEVTLADNSTPLFADGFVSAQISDGATGQIVTLGQLEGLNTSGASVGDPVYLGTGGGITLSKPANDQVVGIVLKVDAVDGWVWFDPSIDYDAGQVPDFQANHVYQANDLIAEGGQLYRAKTGFTSGGSFSTADWEDLSGFDPSTPETFGAVGDGVADDTTAVQAALDTGRCELINSYRITGGLTVSVARTLLDGRGSIVTDQDWINAPVLDITGADSIVRDISILETSASPTNNLKSGATNCGIRLSSTGLLLEGIRIDGFGFGLVARGNATPDDCTIRRVRVTNAYSWGIEIDAVKNLQLLDCESNNNGLDGIKVQNEYSRTCDGLVVDGCVATTNGQRDTAAGGSESTNGNGIDLFAGGYRFKLSNNRFYGNYGNGLKLTGTPPQPQMGEGQIVSCDFTGNLDTSSDSSHGVNIASVATSAISFSDCNMSNNASDGIFCQDSHSVSFARCNAIANTSYGATLAGGFDNRLRDCNLLGNQGLFGIRIGTANDASYVSRRHLIDGCRISGNYDEDLSAGGDPRDAQTEIFTQRGIQIYSDCADVTIRDSHLYNLRDYAINNYAQNLKVLNSHFYDLPTFGIYNQSGSTVEVSDSVFSNAAQTVQFQSGTGTQPAIGTTMTGGTSGATGIVKAIVVSGGSFGGGDAVGTLYLYEVSGDFGSGESITGGGATVTSTSVDTPFVFRALGTRAVVKHNIMTLAAARAFIFAIYLDDTLNFSQLEGNQIDSDFAQGVEAESGVAITSFGVTYTENQVAAAGSPPGTYQVQQGSSRGVYSSSGVGEPVLLAPFTADGIWPIF